MNKVTHYMKKLSIIFVLMLLMGQLIFAYNYQDNVAPSQNPPGGLQPQQVPQLVSIGFDDNAYSGEDGSAGTGGMKWANDFFSTKTNPIGNGNKATFDGDPVTVSYYYAATYIGMWGSESPTYVKRAWHNAYAAGHEAGNHTYAHGHGQAFTVNQWQDEMQKCIDWLVKPFDPNEPTSGPDNSKGIGVTPGDISGFRTPYLEYNDNAFVAMKNVGLVYDCSIEDGHQPAHDGTNFFWPYTLDGGSPGHAYLYQEKLKDFPLGNHPGVWEVPAHPVIVPPDDKCAEYGINYSLRDQMKTNQSWFDVTSGKITGLDYNMWVQFKMTKAEFLATLKYTLDIRYNGNRAPFTYGAHSDEYSSKYTAPPNATLAERQQAIEEFVNYAISKSDVRFVNVKNIVDWCRNPVPLGPAGPTPTATLTPTPTGPTATMTPTPTPTQTPTATPFTIDPWAVGVRYEIGAYVTHNNKYWICTVAHTSLDGWYPGAPGVHIWEETSSTPTPPPITPTPTQTPTPTATATPTPMLINIALGKKVTVSSNYAASSYPASNTVDGNVNTVWGTAYNASGSEWLYVDLGGITDINGIRMKWYDVYYASKYQLATSTDLKTWTFIHQTSTGQGGVEELISPVSQSCRYVGILLESGSKGIYAFTEFEILAYDTTTPTPTVTTTVPPTQTVPPTPDASGELSLVYSTDNETGTSFTGTIVASNPNSTYAWNGTFFVVDYVEFETTSTITSVSNPNGGPSFTQDGNKVTLRFGHERFFPMNKSFNVTIKGNKAGANPYPVNFKTKYIHGDIIYPAYQDLPASWHKGKTNLTAADLIVDQTAYYDSVAKPITDTAIMYNPPNKTQLQLGLAPEIVFPAGVTMNGASRIRAYIPMKLMAMGMAFAYQELGANPNWLAAIGSKENWAAAISNDPGVQEGQIVTIDGIDYRWPIHFNNADGPYQVESINFQQIADFFRDYFPPSPVHGNYMTVSSDLSNPNWISSAFTAGLSLTISRELLTSSDKAKYNEFMAQAADPMAELTCLTYGFNRGVDGLSSKKLFSTNRAQALASTNLAQDFDMIGVSNHLPIVKTIVSDMNAETSRIYDAELTWADLEVFFAEMRTFFGNGVPSDADWSAMKADAKRAYDVLSQHWGGTHISCRYDFITIVRIMNKYRPYPLQPRPTGETWYYRVTGLNP